MEKEELQKAYDGLKRLHGATNQAVQSLEQENIRLQAVNRILVSEKRQWEEERATKDRVIHETITEQNALHNSYLEEIEELKGMIKKLKEEK